MLCSGNGAGTSSSSCPRWPVARPLKETRTNETDLMKLLSVRNGIFKKGENGQEPPCCHLIVICGIDSGLWLDLELSTAEVQGPWPRMECLLRHRRSWLPVYAERMGSGGWGEDKAGEGAVEATARAWGSKAAFKGQRRPPPWAGAWQPDPSCNFSSRCSPRMQRLWASLLPGPLWDPPGRFCSRAACLTAWAGSEHTFPPLVLQKYVWLNRLPHLECWIFLLERSMKITCPNLFPLKGEGAIPQSGPVASGARTCGKPVTRQLIFSWAVWQFLTLPPPPLPDHHRHHCHHHLLGFPRMCSPSLPPDRRRPVSVQREAPSRICPCCETKRAPNLEADTFGFKNRLNPSLSSEPLSSSEPVDLCIKWRQQYLL